MTSTVENDVDDEHLALLVVNNDVICSPIFGIVVCGLTLLQIHLHQCYLSISSMIIVDSVLE